MSEVPAQYICADRIQRLSMVEDDSQVIDQLIERVRSRIASWPRRRLRWRLSERRENTN
jgi:hypothetical protein